MRILNFFVKAHSALVIISVLHGASLFSGNLSSAVVQKVQDASLKQEQERQAANSGIDNRSLLEIEEATGHNKYTQTEAYLQVPSLRKLVLNTFESSWMPVDYMNIVSTIMVREAEFKNKYWVFYHGAPSSWVLPRDIYKKLHNYFKPMQKAGNDFTFFRFTDQSLPQAKELLLEGLKTYGLIDDNGAYKGMLLAANLSLFGNTGFRGESTWRYFMTKVEHVPFDRSILEKMMDMFGVTHKYIDELLELSDLLRTKEQTLFQIFVPQNIVDNVGYLAYETGIPAHDETINWIKTNIKQKKYKKTKTKTADMVALESLKDKLKKQKENNPLFNDLIKSVEDDDYSLDSTLKIYCNQPSEIPNLNYMQARLLLSNDALLNPNAGIKMFMYTTVKRNKAAEYKKRLNEIIQKIVTEKK